MSSVAERIYSIKRHGTTIDSCDSEPVQTPGCVQAHGVLLVLRPGDLVVLQVSENCARHLGKSPEEILGRGVADVLGEACAEHVRDCVARQPVERNPTIVSSIDPEQAGDAAQAECGFDVTAHTVDGVILVELEPPAGCEAIRNRDYCGLIRRTTARIQAARSLHELFQSVVEEVRRITGLSRVMVYRFHPDETGEVVAEDRREDLPSWLGYRYPPHDIPRPAREIFNKIWVRPVPDAQADLAEMVPLVNPATGRPLEMTHCALRGASVMYTEYLQNMGVAASLTMSLRSEGALWGLIACHHDTPIEMPYQMRAICEFVAQFTSMQLGPVADREHRHYRLRMESVHGALLERAAEEGDLSSMLQNSPSLLDGIRASGVAICYRDRWWAAGTTPAPEHLTEIADWVLRRLSDDPGGRPVFATDRLPAEMPAAMSYSTIGSGLLAVPVARGRRHMILWFRPEIEQTLSWGGNPHELPVVAGPHGPRLSPRKSFELWQEVVRGRSDPWDPVEIDAAYRLKLFVMELVIRRAEQLAEINEDLARSYEELDAFAFIAAHDLKEPLRGINKHAQLLCDEIQAGRGMGRPALDRLGALLRLTVRMDGLLDSLLRFSRVGRYQMELVDTPLSPVLKDAIEMLGSRVLESGVQIRIPRPLPTLRCERVRVREIFSNLISNAVKYSDKQDRWIEIGFIAPGEPPPPFYRAELAPPEAAGQCVLYVRDNGIGIEPRYQAQIFRMFKRLHAREAYGGGSGVGLAIVKKLVTQLHGVVWMDSTPRVGSAFYFTLGGAEMDRSER